MPVKVTFKLGNYSGRRLDAEAGLETFMNALGEDVTDAAMDAVKVDVPKLQRVLDTRIKASLGRAINYAAMNMIGLKSASFDSKGKGNISPTRIYFEQAAPASGDEAMARGNVNAAYQKANAAALAVTPYVSWQPLHFRTLKKKASTVGPDAARKHYLYTGALREELKALAKKITQSTGTVRIGYIKNSAKRFNAYRAKNPIVKAGQLQLSFLPNIPISKLPGLATGRITDFSKDMLFEKSLGLSELTLEKLRGPNVDNGDHFIHRPLLQPVVTYWALKKIPELVAGSIANSLTGK